MVPCGHCSACLQSKANKRAERIRLHTQTKALTLFVTLTYNNYYVPYIKKSDLERARILSSVRSSDPINLSDSYKIPVYRDYDVRYYNHVCYSKKLNDPLFYIDSSDFNDGSFIPVLSKKRDCMGVIYYKDVQNFIKRLRINLSRAGYDDKVTYYAVGEYGGTRYRPHFHLLLHFEKGSIETYKPFIVKSWLYGDLTRSDKRIQVAVNASSYVSEYVNKLAGLPKICESPVIKQKHSHSFRYALDLPIFSLQEILEKVSRGALYYSKQVFVDGVSRLVDVPYSNYVINRFFPRFKGDSLFAPDEIRQFLLAPESYRSRLGSDFINYHFDIHEIDPDNGFLSQYVLMDIQMRFNNHDIIYNLSNLEFSRFCVHLNNCINEYCLLTGKTKFDYVIDYMSVWSCHRSTILKFSYRDVNDFTSFYYNTLDLYHGSDWFAPTLPRFRQYELNPNSLSDVVLNTRVLSDRKYYRDNIRSTNGLILSSIYDDL